MSDPGKLNLDNYEKMKAQMVATPTGDPSAPPAGNSAQAIAAAPAGTIPQDQPQGFFSKAVSAVKNVVTGAGAGVARIPGETAAGVLHAAADVSNAAFDHTVLPFGKWLNDGPERFPGQKAIAASMINDAPLNFKKPADWLSSKDYLGTVGNSAVNQGVANIGSLILGGVAVGEAKLFQFAPKVIAGGLNFGIAAGALMDPDSERLSAGLKGLGVHSEFTDWLGASPDQAGPMENRFKNAVENTGLGVAGDAVFQGAKYLRSVIKGAPDGAAKAAAEGAYSEILPEAAHPSHPTVTSVQGAGTVDIRVDGETITTLPKASFNGLVADGKDATTGNLVVARQVEDGTVLYGRPGQMHHDLLQPGEDYTDRIFNQGGFATGDGQPFLSRQAAMDWVKENQPGRFAKLPESTKTDGGGLESSDYNYTRGGADYTSGEASPLPGLDSDAFAPTLRAMAIKLHDTPHVVRSDVERNAMATSIANEVGLDPTDILAYGQHIAGNVTDVDVGITAMQMGWRKVASDLDAVASQGLSETATEAEIQQHKAAIANAVNLSGSFQTVRSSMGRGLRATSPLKKAADYVKSKLGIDEEAPAFNQEAPIPPQPNTVQEINDFHSVWNDLKSDPEARQNFLRGTYTLPTAWKYLRTSFANNFTANALAGLPSLSMNTVGPTIIGVLHTLEKTTGGFINALNPLLTPAERAASLSVATNASRAYVQTVAQIPDAFRFAWQAAKDNRAILGGNNTIDVGRMGPISPEMIRAANGQDAPTMFYQLGNAINFWPRNFQRINAGLDEFAKRLSYMGEIRLNAAVEHDTSPALQAATSKASYIKQAMENSIDAVGEATDETALRSAERTTFTGALSGNDYHPLVGKASDLVQSMRSEFPETRYIMPVFNVPANALGETIRRLPGVNLLLGETRDELLGNLGAVRQADAYGRTMLGAGFLMWAYHAARNGQLTGGGPTDAGNRKAWSDQGYQPYSVRMGDHWVDYSRYDLPGAILGVAANLYDTTVYHRQDDPGVESRMVATMGALAQYFKDKAALQGASTLMNFGGNPSADTGLFDRTMQSIAVKSVVPNFVTQLGRNVMDPTKRSATSISEALMNSIPLLSQKLDPMRNVLGEPLHVPRDTVLENAAPLTITPATTFKSDPVMSELDRLRQATGSAPGVTHHSEFDGNYYDSTQVKLENGHSLYDAIIAARQTTVDPNTGNNLRGALSALFGMPEYKAAMDADASNLMDSSGNVSRGAVVAKVFNTYNKAAIQAVAKESPIARKMLAITAAKKIDDARLRPYAATDLADNPMLLKSLGIDLQKYENKVSGQ